MGFQHVDLNLPRYVECDHRKLHRCLAEVPQAHQRMVGEGARPWGRR